MSYVLRMRIVVGRVLICLIYIVYFRSFRQYRQSLGLILYCSFSIYSTLYGVIYRNFDCVNEKTEKRGFYSQRVSIYDVWYNSSNAVAAVTKSYCFSRTKVVTFIRRLPTYNVIRRTILYNIILSRSLRVSSTGS